MAPSVAATAASVSVNESETAANTGTFSDPGMDDVALSASVGSITDNGDGTWSWSYTPQDDSNAPTSVTITASDGVEEVTTTFDLSVNNLAPTAMDDVFSVFEDDLALALDLLTKLMPCSRLCRL